MNALEVGVITDEVSQDIDQALQVMKRCNVRQAEIRAVWDKNCTDMDAGELARLKKALDAAGATVCGIASPFFKCDLVKGVKAERGRMHQARDLGLDEQMALLERCFHVAEFLGTTFIRVFSFWRTEDPTPEICQHIADMFEKPLALAEKRGMKLLLENEHSCYLGSGAETAEVMKLIKSPAAGCVWDPGNAYCAGEIPYPGGYEAVKPWIVHVHIKDCVRQPDGEMKFVKIGTGEVDYSGQFASLKADGYNGVVSLESHYGLEIGGRPASAEESLLAIHRFVNEA